MLRKKQFWLVVTTLLLVWACAEKEPAFPWMEDINAEVDTQGKMVGYEFWAKW